MPILYGAVAHGKRVLSKYASCDGNFDEILDTVLTRLPDVRDHKMTYSHGHYLFHCIAERGYVYFCIADKSCQRSRAFLFLNEIKRKWDSDGGDHILFTNTLATEMYRYNEDYSTITIMRGELDELNSIGVSSSECILGEKILHVHNPDNLSYSTITYVSNIPERIKVSVSDTRILIFGAVIFILSAAAFDPLSCCYFAIIILGVKLMLRI